jgi:SAM-dependent methyltransferase
MNNRSVSTVRQYFDEHSDGYVGLRLNNLVALHRKKNAFFNFHVQYDSAAPLSVLDIGSGGGIWADLFLEDYPLSQIVCLDISLGMLRRSRSRPRKYAVVGDGKQLPFPKSCFDLINLDSLMHHLVNREGYLATILNMIEFLRSLKSVLRPQGKLIISEIYHESFIRDDMVSRLLFMASTSTLPTLLTLPVRRFIRTQGVGICFLSRKQWFWVIARSGYRIEGWKELKWDIPFLRRLAGFKASGDLVFLLSPI